MPLNGALDLSGLGFPQSRLGYTPFVAKPIRTTIPLPARQVSAGVNPLTGALVTMLLDHP